MDEKKTIDELKNTVRDFCEERDWTKYHNPKDLAIGISTEANELLDLFRFKSLDEVELMFAKPNKKNLIENELADTLFFILRFAQLNNIDLDNSLKNKLNINEGKYPKESSYGSNVKYDEEI